MVVGYHHFRKPPYIHTYHACTSCSRGGLKVVHLPWPLPVRDWAQGLFPALGQVRFRNGYSVEIIHIRVYIYIYSIYDDMIL